MHLNHTEIGLIIYWLYSAVVGGMPDITPTSGTGYIWVYHTLHILAGSVPQSLKQILNKNNSDQGNQNASK